MQGGEDRHMHGWAKFGKPDFSRAAQLFYRLPHELRESMSRSEEKTLIWTLFFAWTSAFHSGRNSALTSFSQTWVGEHFGRSRWTVGRALAKLEERGVLKQIRRRPKIDGTYRTNLIALGASITRVLGLMDAQPREKPSMCTTAPQQVQNLNKLPGGVASSSSPPGKQETADGHDSCREAISAVFRRLQALRT